MQTVWSRIAQSTATCRCPSCAATAGGIARRAATATGKRPTKFWTSSTLLYSGIFAAAATNDAAAKEKRLKQWDAAIADVKQGLERGKEDDSQIKAERIREYELRFSEEVPVEERLNYAQGQSSEADGPQTRAQDLDEIEAIFEKAHMTSKDVPIWPSSTGLMLKRRNVPPQSKYATQFASETAARKQWTPKKIRLNELSVDRMVLRMLVWMNLEGMTEDLIAEAPRKARKKFIRPRSEYYQLLEETEAKLRRVRATPVNVEESEDMSLYCHYQHDEYGSHHEAATELNRELSSIFGQYDRLQKGETSRGISQPGLLMYICRRLTTCPVPPNLTCWNTILKGFLDRGFDPRLNSYVIRAMREGHIRMNEDSYINILKHYQRAEDREGFVNFVGLMQGQNGGLALAKSGIKVNEASEGRLIEFFDEVAGEMKIIQKPYQVPSVFNHIVKGVLQFAGFRTAIEICQSMGREGWGSSMVGMTSLLQNCALRSDWESGREVWNQIKLIQSKSRRRGVAEKIQARTYVSMLAMCVACEQEYDYDEVLVEAVLNGHSQDFLLKQLREMANGFGDPAASLTPANPTRHGGSGRRKNSRYIAPRYEPEAPSDTSESQTYDMTAVENSTLRRPTWGTTNMDESVHDDSAIRPREHDPPIQSTPHSRQAPGQQYQEPIHQSQLWGDMAASQDLDIYENTERPMSLYL
ncbi:hypothetical protein MBLNU457_5416t1 [Dothideomycetes sp. NU457]